MPLKILLIGGTGAPKKSQFYYQPIIDVALEHVDIVDFEAIFLLGFGNMSSSAAVIGKKYFSGGSDKFVVIGHSQGAILATLLAIDHPERVLAVISLAGPFSGTTWTDPLNMPIRGFVELVNLLTAGRIRLKPVLRQQVLPVLPIISDLRAHSEVCDKVLDFLKLQESGHETHAIIGSSDMLISPRRSANPNGKMVTNYIATGQKDFARLRGTIPPSIKHINSRVGHISIVSDSAVLLQISEIIAMHKTALNTQD